MNEHHRDRDGGGGRGIIAAAASPDDEVGMIGCCRPHIEEEEMIAKEPSTSSSDDATIVTDEEESIDVRGDLALLDGDQNCESPSSSRGDEDDGEDVAAVAVGRTRKLRHRRRHRFVTDSSLALTAATVVLLGVLSVVFSPRTTMSPAEKLFDFETDPFLRNLEDGQATDYSSQSCGELYENTGGDRDKQCQYAHECNYGEGVFAPIVFCSQRYSTRTLCLLLSPIFVILLVTLFRMLGSTAEDFFSPALEMFSVKLGLPPRFAGVSLLALGNGAADVSATMNAIILDPTNGYRLSLGALTGAGMFVGTVVAGVVIVVAEGVPCRGALVRDVVMFVLTLLVVYLEFASGSIGTGAITLFIVMYVVFVFIVLGADIYHRRVVRPRMEALREEREKRRQEDEARRAREVAAALVGTGMGEELSVDVHPEESTEVQIGLNGQRQPSILITHSSSVRSPSGSPTETTTAVPIKKNSRLGRIMAALSNYSTRVGDEDGYAGSGWGVTEEDGTERLVVFHGRHGGLMNVNSMQSSSTAADASEVSNDPLSMEYQAMMEAEDGDEQHLPQDSTFGLYLLLCSAEDWVAAFVEGRRELRDHFKLFWDDIYANEENNILDKFLLTFELPFTVLRKLTVPIPCEGYYCRPLVALSIAFSPLWFALYLFMGYDTNMFGGGLPSLYLFIFTTASIIVGLLVLRLAPPGEGPMPQHYQTPIALYGFVIAATWIDCIADELVTVLSFLGIVCYIPRVIMGLTILAWGNSMGDMSANMTMAKKGLANMAMTACFAGPVFNILIGLGLGFSSLISKTGQATANVEHFPRTAKAGFVFLLLNCILVLVSGLLVNKGSIPKTYGYIALALYVCYLVVAIWVFYA